MSVSFSPAGARAREARGARHAASIGTISAQIRVQVASRARLNPFITPSVTFWAHVVESVSPWQRRRERLPRERKLALSALPAGARPRRLDRETLRVPRAYPRGHVGRPAARSFRRQLRRALGAERQPTCTRAPPAARDVRDVPLPQGRTGPSPRHEASWSEICENDAPLHSGREAGHALRIARLGVQMVGRRFGLSTLPSFVEG